MPVTMTHPEYRKWEPDWIKCRDAYNGQRDIKAKGPQYLPRLTGQTDSEYKAYKERALFYAITSKTVGAMLGMAISKPPVLKYPKGMEYYFEERSGIQFHETMSTSIAENLLMGRFGALVDRPKEGGRPYIRYYLAEDILNWKTDMNGDPYLVVLREYAYTDETDDRFNQDTCLVYRVLELVNGKYVQTLYDEKGGYTGEVVPTNTGKTMSFIPFFVLNPFGVGFETTKPPMLDIVDINISHYRTSADLEHGRHFTGLPTPVVIGVAPDTKLKIGSMTAWVLPDPSCDAKFLEFTGQGLQSLEKAMEEKQAQLASLSARLLDNSSNGSEAADTVKLRYMSETASLASIIRADEAFLNSVFKAIAIMEELNPNEVSILLDKEFLNTRLNAQEILKLTESFLQGGMSAEAYVFNLRRGDALPADRSDEDEIKAAQEARQKVIDAAEAAAKKAAATGGPTN